jgi:hypothetical protein
MELSDLNSKGFCVIKSLFNPDQINIIRQDFELIKDHDVNKDYPVLPVGKRIPLTEIIETVVAPVSKTISNDIGLITDFSPTPVYFSIKHGVNFNWHQDHESYFYFNDHLNYLNIYVPIYKENKELSNVCVIDFQKLINKDPRMSFLKGYGATSFSVLNGETILQDDNTNTKHYLNFDINEIADCPQLDVGDALIMRGDCIHRTQDTLTPRVAMSIRRMNSASVVKRSNFDITCPAKDVVYNGNKQHYQKILDKFGNAEQKLLGELLDVYAQR